MQQFMFRNIRIAIISLLLFHFIMKIYRKENIFIVSEDLIDKLKNVEYFSAFKTP
jgi:hypothetical protein